MSLLNGSQQENLDFKFIELRKLRLTDSIDHGLFNNLVISTNYQIAFLAFKNGKRAFSICLISICTQLGHFFFLTVIKGIKLSTILDFEWSKSIINQALDNYPCFNIEVDFFPTFLSINGGSNNILVASGQDSANVLRIEFFDVSLILQNFLNSINRLETGLNGNVNICSLDWHPEFSESLFVAALTNGSLISVGIDIKSKGVQILSHLLEPSKLTCVSWSPKGKQLVIGSENGYLTQYKHVNGKNFQKVKFIPPPKELVNFKVVNVCWVHTSLFQVAFINPNDPSDPDTRVVFVHAVPKAQPEYFDFGRVCIDGLNYTGPDKFHFSLNLMGNVLFCTSSSSSEIGVIGCINREVTPTPVTWNMWILDDTSRIELQPAKNGNDSYSCGLAWFKGPTKVFQVNESVTFGGENVPLILILSSSGLLCPYYAFDSSNNLFIPNAPNFQPLPINLPPPALKLESKFIQPVKPAAPAQSVMPSSVLFNTSSTLPTSGDLMSNFLTKSGTSFAIQTSPAPVSHHSEQSAVNKPQTVGFQPQAIVTQPVQSAQQLSTQKPTESKPAALAVPVVSEAELKKREEKAREEAFSYAITYEVAEFDREFKAIKNKYSQVLSQKVGDNDEKSKIKADTLALADMLKLMQNTLKSIDIVTLNGFMLETFAMEQEAQSRLERDSDPVYTALFYKKSLDPISARKMREIKKLAHYIENQLQECNFILDQEWNEYIATINKTKSAKNDSSSLYLITQTLSNNYKVIELLKSRLRELDLDFKPSQITFPKQSYNINKVDIQELIESLEETKIKDNINYDADLNFLKPGIEIKRLNKEKKEKILEVLEQRTFVPVIRSNLPVDIESSKMISAVVKAKEKLKTIKSKNAMLSSTSSELRVSSYSTQKQPSPSVFVTTATSTSSTPSTLSAPALPSTFPTFNLKPAETSFFQPKPDSISANLQTSTTHPTKDATIAFNFEASKPTAASFSMTPKKELAATSVSSNLTFDKKVTSNIPASSKTSTPVKSETVITKTSPKPPAPKYDDVTPPSSPSFKFNTSPTAAPFTVSTPSKLEPVTLKFSSSLSTGSEKAFNVSNVLETSKSSSSLTKHDTTSTSDSIVAVSEDKPKVTTEAVSKSPVSLITTSVKTPQAKGSAFKLEQSPSSKTPQNLTITSTSTFPTLSFTSSASINSITASPLFSSASSNLPQSSEPQDLSQSKSQSQETVKTQIPALSSSLSSATSTVTLSSAKDTKPTEPTSTTKESTNKLPEGSLFSPNSLPSITQPLPASISPMTSIFGNPVSKSESSIIFGNTFFGTTSSTISSPSSQTATCTVATTSLFTSSSASPFSSATSFTNTTSPVIGSSTSPPFSSTVATTGFQSKPTSTFKQAEQVSFSFGSALQNLGARQTQGNVSQNSFGGAISNPTPQVNLFGGPTNQPVQQPQQQSTPMFSNTPSSNSFASGGTGVAQAGFGTFQNTSPIKLEQFKGPPTFGSPPLFGGQKFGTSHAFGSLPTFGSPSSFNSSPEFGSAVSAAPFER